MVDVVRGSVSKPVSTELLAVIMQGSSIQEGTLYLGYPVIGSIEGITSLDAVLICKPYGIIVFDVIEGDEFDDRTELQDNIFAKLSSKLYQNKSLLKNRQLAIDINIVTFAPACPNTYGLTIKNLNEFEEYLKNIQDNINEDLFKHLTASIQVITNIRGKSQRPLVKKEDSLGGKLKQLEQSIANLDRKQSTAVIESVEGIQRIRGLAGSGKTIVLALKVAYLHATHPDWLIAVTFNTRSLKGQFQELITKFTIGQIDEEPNWERVRIIHAWGSPSTPGLYYETCKSHNVEYLDFQRARTASRLSNMDEFEYVCNKALNEMTVYNETYDAILIDEAQDFSESFLRLCFNLLKQPKRLVYAYDELQKLSEASLRSPKDIFGQNIEFDNLPNKPKQDIILEKCYRNSRPVLVSAHALGFGVYNKNGLIQMFDQPELWKDVGYDVESGTLDFGRDVTLYRPARTSPEFLEKHSPINELINFYDFSSEIDQYHWIADQIEKNLKDDELGYKDIIVIHANPLKTKTQTGYLRDLLYEKKINSHLVGVSNSQDNFFENNSIAFTSIHRAKGNEAYMVYIMDAQECYSGSLGLITKRNILFTAITRSKAWVKVCGFGQQFIELSDEFRRVEENGFTLNFTFPTLEQLKKINLVHRDVSEGDVIRIKKTNTVLRDLIEGIETGVVHPEDIPDNIKDSLRKYLK